MQNLPLNGSVIVVASDRGHHFSKSVQSAIVMVEGLGVEGDAHAGAFVQHRYLAKKRPRLPNLRQVHLIPGELFEHLHAVGYDVRPGDLGENVTTRGLELDRLPLGTLLKLGEYAVVELTGLRTPCVLIDRFQRGLKSHVIQRAGCAPKFKCGVLGVVRAGGSVTAGDVAVAVVPCLPWHPLPML
jgi:MOSC domain-containing protein YiiM